MDRPINSLTFKSQYYLICYLIPEIKYLDLNRYPVSNTINNTSSLQQSPIHTSTPVIFIEKRRLKGYRHCPKMPIIMDRIYDRSELTDPEQICLLDTPNFLLFIKEKGIQVYQLDFKTIMETGIPDPETPNIPDLIEDKFQALFAGNKDTIYWTNKLNPTYHGFINNIFNIDTETFYRVTDNDITKFLKGKKELTLNKFKTKLPKKHHAFLDLFQRKNIDILPPYRSYDYKIEIMPNKESLSQKNKSFSQPEFMVIKK